MLPPGPWLGAVADPVSQAVGGEEATDCARLFPVARSLSGPIECSEKPFSQEVLIQAARLTAGEVNDYTDSDGQDSRRITDTLSEVLQSSELDRTKKFLTIWMRPVT
jgi:hypothetical protein